MAGGLRLLRAAGIGVVVVLILLFSVFPFMQMLSISPRHQPGWGNPSPIPTRVNWDAYRELLAIGQDISDLPASAQRLLDNPEPSRQQRERITTRFRDNSDLFPFLHYFRNSFTLAASAALIFLLLGTFGAYSFSRVCYKDYTAVQRGVLFVYLFGGILLVIPLFQLTVPLGLGSTDAGTFIAILAINMVQTLPVSLYMLANYFRTIPLSIEEAATIDGCTRLKTIRRIIIPHLLPALSAVSIYSFMIPWNKYLFASVFLKSYNDLFTLPLGLRTRMTPDTISSPGA